MQTKVLKIINSFLETSGFYAFEAEVTVLEEMQRYNMALLFFNLIFNIVILIFIAISVLLIYSLLMIGVETKTLETGIMRMVGVGKRGLVQMIFVQSFMFVLPALVVGFALCFPMLALCFKYIFKEQLTGAFAPIPTWQGVLMALAVGIIIPALASILPVLKVLG